MLKWAELQLQKHLSWDKSFLLIYCFTCISLWSKSRTRTENLEDYYIYDEIVRITDFDDQKKTIQHLYGARNLLVDSKFDLLCWQVFENSISSTDPRKKEMNYL